MPRLAGLHPIYIARQLYLFKDGTRNGPDAQLMKKPAAKLTDEASSTCRRISDRWCPNRQSWRPALAGPSHCLTCGLTSHLASRSGDRP